MSAQPGSPKVWKALLLALLAVVLWSGNFIAARGLHNQLPPVTIAFFRWVTAVLVLYPLAAGEVKRQWPLLKKHLGYLLLVALTGIALFNTLIYVAAHTTTATNMALLGTTATPVFVLVIAAVVLRSPVYWNQYLGAAICVAGILVLLSQGSLDKLKDFRFQSGDVWVLSAAFFFAIYTLLIKRKPKEMGDRAFLFAIFLLGMFMLLPVWVWEITTVASPLVIDFSFLWIFLYLGLGASVISFLSWNYTISVLGPARTALFGNLIPVFSAIEAVILLNEAFTQYTLISMLLIGAGILTGNLKKVLSKAK